ncbi:MAG: DHH family phosphoesterase [Desulfobacterales bacterium]|nr:DHH family phosphoesterase [Desulfobacterales bacterium]
MNAPKNDKLKKFYSRFSGEDQVIIVINADPDAISSAMAVKRLLWRKVAGVTISNVNIITRPDNLAMVRLLSVKLIHFEKIDLSCFSKFIIVDSQQDHNEAFNKFSPDIIIDHHPVTCNSKASFKDIRPQYGATATIMTEYLNAARIKPSAKLATALFLGIKTDTNNFGRHALNEDVVAFQFLFKHANHQLAKKIEQAELRFDMLKYFRRAMRHMHFVNGRMYVDVGPVLSPDICVMIADFFMRVNLVKWSIVSGVYEDKLIIIFRNDGLKKNAGKLAKDSFGQIGSAGGHKSMARAEIDLHVVKDFVSYTDYKTLYLWIRNRIEKRGKSKRPENDAR